MGQIEGRTLDLQPKLQACQAETKHVLACLSSHRRTSNLQMSVLSNPHRWDTASLDATIPLRHLVTLPNKVQTFLARLTFITSQLRRQATVCLLSAMSLAEDSPPTLKALMANSMPTAAREHLSRLLASHLLRHPKHLRPVGPVNTSLLRKPKLNSLAAEPSCSLDWSTTVVINPPRLPHLPQVAVRLMLVAVAASVGHAPSTRTAVAHHLAMGPLLAVVDPSELVAILPRLRRQRGKNSSACARELGIFSTLERLRLVPYLLSLGSAPSTASNFRLGVGNMGLIHAGHSG